MKRIWLQILGLFIGIELHVAYPQVDISAKRITPEEFSTAGGYDHSDLPPIQGYHINSLGFQALQTSGDETTFTDDFNRDVLGPDWNVYSDEKGDYWQITNGELDLTDLTHGDWEWLAVFNRIPNKPGQIVTEVSFKWGRNASKPSLLEGAIALMLDWHHPKYANGYWIAHRLGHLYFWTMVNGNISRGIDFGYVSSLSEDPKAGDVIRIRIRQENDGNYFDYYINGNQVGTVRDPWRMFPKGNYWYTGVFRQGGSYQGGAWEHLMHQIDDYGVTYRTVGPDAPPTINNIRVENNQASNYYRFYRKLEIEDMPMLQNAGFDYRSYRTEVHFWGGYGNSGQQVFFPESGYYRFTVRGYGPYVRSEWPIVDIRIDNITVASLTISSSTVTDMKTFSTELYVGAGRHEIGTHFSNYIYIEDPDPSRILWLDWIEISRENTPNSTVNLSWTTDEPSDSQVEYGTTLNNMVYTNTIVNLTQNHTVALEGLPQEAPMYVRVISRDVYRNWGVTDPFLLNPYTHSLTGHIVDVVEYNSTHRPIPSVQVQITGGITSSQTTDTNGSYVFNDLKSTSAITVTPSKVADQNTLGLSLSAFDAVLAARQAVGLENLSLIQRTAADANQNGIVDIMDASLIARASVGLPSIAGSKAGTWKFTPQDTTFSDLIVDKADVDFKGQLIGDVNGSWSSSSLGKSASWMPFSSSVLPDSTGGFAIPVKIENGQQCLSADFQLAYSPEDLEFLDAAAADHPSPSSLVINAEPGRVRLALWRTIGLEGPAELVELRFRSLRPFTTVLTWERILFNGKPSLQSETVIQSSVEGRRVELPSDLNLKGNYPNPFNGATVIRYHVPEGMSEELSVFDVSGRKIAELAQGSRGKGDLQISWDGRDETGTDCPSGIYFYRLQAGGRMLVGKMIKMK